MVLLLKDPHFDQLLHLLHQLCSLQARPPVSHSHRSFLLGQFSEAMTVRQVDRQSASDV